MNDATRNLSNLYHQFGNIFLKDHGFNGILYRVGDFVICDTEVEKLAEISKIIALPLQPTQNLLICKMFEFCSTDHYSGHRRIVSTSLQERGVFTSNLIQRKVMIYTISDDEALVIDYDRPTLPISSIDIDVPFYPAVNDMLVIVGADENYYGLVAWVNELNKEVNLLYYEKDKCKKYIFKSQYPRDTVLWDCIKCLCNGHWGDKHVLYYI